MQNNSDLAYKLSCNLFTATYHGPHGLEAPGLSVPSVLPSNRGTASKRLPASAELLSAASGLLDWETIQKGHPPESSPGLTASSPRLPTSPACVPATSSGNHVCDQLNLLDKCFSYCCCKKDQSSNFHVAVGSKAIACPSNKSKAHSFKPRQSLFKFEWGSRSGSATTWYRAQRHPCFQHPCCTCKAGRWLPSIFPFGFNVSASPINNC